MPCILCLKADKHLLSTAMHIFSNEAKNLNVIGILKQHFWIEPKENDTYTVICKECWNCLIEFHEFYLRVERAYQSEGLKNFKTANELKIEQNENYFESFDQSLNEFKEVDLLEESPIDVIDNALSENALSNSLEENEKNTKASCHKSINSNEISHIKNRRSKRGRPPKRQEIKTEKHETSINCEEAQKNLSHNLDDLELLAESNAIVTKTKRSISENALSNLLEENEKNTKASCHKSIKSNELSHIKNRRSKRGRPPKRQEIKTEKHETSINSEEAPKNQLHNLDYLELLAENNEKVTETTRSASRRDLSQYDSFISENIQLNCALCKEDFDNFTKLQSHFRKIHKTHGYVLCCGKKLLKRGVLVDHLYTHKDPEYFKCTKCSKVLANRRCLELHQQTHAEKGEPSFKCEICSKAFHLRRVYMLHVESHTPLEMRKFECQHCNKRYASKYVLNNHIRLVHLNKYSRICDICGKKVIGSEAFRVHQEQHKGVQQKLLKCDICGATAKTKYHLKRHQKVKHSAEYQSPQQCKYCSKISPNMLALKQHINFMHSLQKKYKCSMCEKSFKRSQALKEHFSTHTGDVLYFCNFCPRSFNSSANMYAHRKKKHPNEWAQHSAERASNPSISLTNKLTTQLESK